MGGGEKSWGGEGRGMEQPGVEGKADQVGGELWDGRMNWGQGRSNSGMNPHNW